MAHCRKPSRPCLTLFARRWNNLACPASHPDAATPFNARVDIVNDPVSTPANEPQDRRSFFARAAASVVGLVVGMVPIVSGLVVFFDPLARKSRGGQFVRITTLAAVPPDGQPRRFPVIAERADAWSHYPPEPIGSVYLRRTEKFAVPEAFTTVCPHLGCAVNFQPGRGQYLCPCHNSVFGVDGLRIDPAATPSPRDLDSLAVEIRNGQEVWVDYRRFVGGIREKVEEYPGRPA